MGDPDSARGQPYAVPVQWVPAASGPRLYPSLPLLVSAHDDGANITRGHEVLGLIDTGADHSEFAPGVFSSSELRRSRVGKVHTSVGLKTASYFHVSIMVKGIPVVIDSECSLGENDEFFGHFNFVVGRDILSMGTLVLDRTVGGSFSMDLAVLAPKSAASQLPTP